MKLAALLAFSIILAGCGGGGEGGGSPLIIQPPPSNGVSLIFSKVLGQLPQGISLELVGSGLNTITNPTAKLISSSGVYLIDPVVPEPPYNGSTLGCFIPASEGATTLTSFLSTKTILQLTFAFKGQQESLTIPFAESESE